MKKKVIFVGAFNRINSETSGGVLFECEELLQSPLSDRIDWKLINTTPLNNLQRSLFHRSWVSIQRFAKYLVLLLGDTERVLIFMGGYQGSIIEKGFMAILARITGKKVVLCPRTGALPDIVKNSWFMKKFIHFVFSCSYKVVCQGKTWKKYFIQQFGYQDKYIVIYNWINLKKYRPHYLARQAREANGKTTVLFMGWMIKDKGVFELLDAMTNLKNPNLELWMAGNGDDLLSIQQKVDSLNLTNVKFLGWVTGEKKMEILKAADIFTLPSYYEGMPNALLEAIAVGVPVIATNVGSIPDLIVDGKGGFLIEPRDAQSLFRRMELLISDSDLRKSFSSHSYKVLQQNHSYDAAIANFRNVLL